MARERNNAALNQYDLFTGELEQVVDNSSLLKNKSVRGVTIKDKVTTVKLNYASTSKISLEDYCSVICEWLRINKDAYSVLDFYEDDLNAPFEYPLKDTCNNEDILKLLELRISRDAATGILRGTITQDLMKNIYGWRDKTSVNSPDDSLEFELNDD